MSARDEARDVFVGEEGVDRTMENHQKGIYISYNYLIKLIRIMFQCLNSEY